MLSEFQAKYSGSIVKSCTPFTILVLKMVSYPNYYEKGKRSSSCFSDKMEIINRYKESK